INTYRNSKRSIILITHYQRILDYLEPDQIHILIDGAIVKKGGLELVNILEEKGYKWITKESH
ncbi:MAG: Fe-S cluster assembly ATPase SufC, partial [Candidatus Neomarinimicrobiota bacterium]